MDVLHGRRIAVFDAEIKKRIEECTSGWKSHDEMGVSIIVLYDYLTARWRVFDDNNIYEANHILCDYDLVVGFNTVGFDWKLLQATYPTLNWTRNSKDFDILREIWITLGLDPNNFSPKTHGGYKLDDVAAETIGLKKSGSGEHAPVLYQQGRYAELVDYCIQDVKVEKELFEFVLSNGYVMRGGRKIRVIERLATILEKP